MNEMSQNTKEPTKANANTKRSRWKFFPKDRKSSDLEQPELKTTSNDPPSTDSTYSSTAPNSAQPSGDESSPNSSLTIPQDETRQNSITPPPTAQPGLLNPHDALTQHHDNHHSNPDVSVTSPTIRKETRHDPATGNVITIVTTTTTTTTTTTVTGANGTTIIETPRAELGDGRRTPDPTVQNEAVTAAINGQGDGSLSQQSEETGPRPGPGQWVPYTPGRRQIPQRDPNGSVTDLDRMSGLEDQSQPTTIQQGAPVPNLPPRGPTINPLQNTNGLQQQIQPAGIQKDAAAPALPPRGLNRKPLQTPNIQNTATEAEAQDTPISPLGPSRNFSYPTKNQAQSWAQIPQPARPDAGTPKTSTSKMANLRMAAAGIHGAGEALRGTISQSADTYIRANKVTDDRMAKHQEVINRGRYEIENRKLATQSMSAGAEKGRFYQQDPAHAQSFTAPEPDAQPTHIALARRRLSGGYDVRQLSPREEPPPEKSGFGKWLRKSKSHPSDKEKDSNLRPSKPLEPSNGKLKRRSKQHLPPVVE